MDSSDCKEQLIELVKSHPYLYDPTHVKYNDQCSRDKAWKTIAKELERPEKLCRKSWNNLRDAYRRALRKRLDEQTETGKVKSRRWRYDSKMQFLTQHLQRLEESLLKHEQDITTETLGEIRWDDSDDQSRSDLGCKSPDRRLHEETPLSFVEFSNPIRNYDLPISLKNNTDEVDLFFASIAATVKKLSPYTRAVAKGKIFSIVSELEIQDIVANDERSRCQAKDSIISKRKAPSQNSDIYEQAKVSKVDLDE